MTNKPENFSTMSAPVSDAATTYVTNPSDMDIMRWHDSYLVGYLLYPRRHGHPHLRCA